MSENNHIRNRKLILSAGLVLAFTASAVSEVRNASAQSPGITNLGALNGGSQSVARAISSNGNVVVGDAEDADARLSFAFRWTLSSGMESLGRLNDGFSSYATAVNRDGSVIVGTAYNGAAFGDLTAFRWTRTTGMVSLGGLNGSQRSFANGVDATGNVIVGTAPDPAVGGIERAFRWTPASGMVSLGGLNGGLNSFANAVSSDGKVIVGAAMDGAAGNFSRAYRWTQSSGIVSLGVLSGGRNSLATGVNSDGTVVVGFADNGLTFNAFRWTQTTGMTSLGTLSGGSFSMGSAVSGDGNIVVGQAGDPSNGNAPRAFRWAQATGLISVESWLRTNGVSIPSDITFSANGVNDDGSVVVGQLQNSLGFAFIARVSPAGNGMITLRDLHSSLIGNIYTGIQAATLSSLVMHGAHSRPLARRVATGKSCVWTSGDIGRDDHGERDGALGLVEIGGCHRFGHHVQGALSVGRTASRQHLVFNGKSVVRTAYGVAEMLGQVPGTNLWPSVALMYQAGNADMRRGYFNAGAQDSSLGTPNVRTTAARMRIDWENAPQTRELAFTPYADVSYARTRVNGYTESGGGFPARFDARTEKTTVARIGVDAAYAVASNTKLLGRVEGTHRFEHQSATTTGEVIGLFGFDLVGQRMKRDWLRGGAGFETRLGTGTVSAFFNATTQGGVPNYWLNVSYQIAF